MKISELINENDILLDVSCLNKDDVIQMLVHHLDENDCLVSKEKCYEDILLREKNISTGLVQGIAIPHTQSEGVKKCKVSLARTCETLEWETIDGSEVNVVILITVPCACQGEHLKILAQLAEKLMDEEVCQKLHTIKDKKEIIRLLEE